MRDFKFLDDNKHFFPTTGDIDHAISVGRESYLNGLDIDYNPFFTRELYDAFEQGWELEQDYEILRQAQQRANETEQHN